MLTKRDRATVSVVADLADRIAQSGRGQALLIAIFSGALMTVGQPPISIPWGVFLALPLLVWLLNGATGPGRAALVGWGAGFGYFVTGLHWVGHAFLVDADKFAWLLPFAITLLPAGLALFWALAFGVARRFWGCGGFGAVLVLAGVWALAEYARSVVLTGFPWGLIGYVWSETPLAQLGAVFGPHGMTLLTLVLTPLLLMMLAGQVRPWVGLLPSLAIALAWVWGTARVPDEIQIAEDAPVVRVVQPNAPQKLKWDPNYSPVFFDRLLEETAAPPTETGSPDIVIWPETAVTFLPEERPDLVAEIAVAAKGVPVITGALSRRRVDGVWGWTNGLMEIRPDGTIGAQYAKHHLVPFGEYLPLPELLSSIGLSQLVNRGGFVPGPGAQTLNLKGIPSFIPLICYEMIFPHEVLPTGSRPDWIVQVTNDAWFGNFAGPQQHLMQARMRAIETGLPVVRAANTGVSAIIDGYGQILISIPLGQHGNVNHKLPKPITSSFYVTLGDLLGVALSVLALLAGICTRYIGSRG